jgi:multiple sugar transport system permease protein
MAADEIKGSISAQQRIERALGLFTLIGMSCLFVIPFVITLSDSLKDFSEVYAMPRIWIPPEPNFHNYVQIFQIMPLHRFFLNTIIITALTLIGQIGSACVVAYAFARMRWPFRDTLFIFLLATMMIPGQVIMIPLYMLFNWVGWLNTWLPLIVPAYFGGGVFNIFLMRQFFKTIPMALEDAAKIDGCSYMRILLTIMIPLAKPAIATLTVLSFIASWNNFMGPLIYIYDMELFPIALGIQAFNEATAMQPQLVMAASLCSLTPILILFFAAQKYFVRGIVLTGIKG